MASYKNFFETLKEAQMRLQGTVVVYDDEPYIVWRITDHKEDGIFRVYLYPVQDQEDTHLPDVQHYLYSHGNDESLAGPYIDKWMIDNPKTAMMRKQINSPAFNKFRPFPLGMVNSRGKVIYVERQPTRKTEQGLTPQSIDESLLWLVDTGSLPKRGYVNIHSSAFADTVRGKYPTAQECLVNLMDSDVTNWAAAFDRRFALVRGPVNTLFLAYKGDIVGFLPFPNFEVVQVGKKFRHTKEVIEALGLFGNVSVQ